VPPPQEASKNTNRKNDNDLKVFFKANKLMQMLIRKHKFKKKSILMVRKQRKKGYHLILFFLTALCPEACNPKTAVEKKKNGKNDLHLPGKILKTRANQYKNPQDEIKEYN
jgi:hypothetical protein